MNVAKAAKNNILYTAMSIRHNNKQQLSEHNRTALHHISLRFRGIMFKGVQELYWHPCVKSPEFVKILNHPDYLGRKSSVVGKSFCCVFHLLRLIHIFLFHLLGLIHILTREGHVMSHIQRRMWPATNEQASSRPAGFKSINTVDAELELYNDTLYRGSGNLVISNEYVTFWMCSLSSFFGPFTTC